MKRIVYIYRRPNMRSPEWQFQLEIGRGFLDDMFDHRIVNTEREELTFIFPERYLNIVEQRLIFQAIEECFPNLKTLEIHTHSVYIVQCTPNGDARIVEEGVPLDQQSWGQQVCVPYKMKGLQIFGGKINSLKYGDDRDLDIGQTP